MRKLPLMWLLLLLRGQATFRIEGDNVSEGGGFEEGREEGLWNIFLMSILGFTGDVAAD
jgi:hypothetical protein